MVAPADLRFGLKPAVIEALTHVFLQFPEISCVLVYGSRATGKYQSGSDIDLTVKLRSEVTEPAMLLSKIRDRLEELNLIYTIDLSLYNQIRNPDLIEHINRVGVRLYD